MNPFCLSHSLTVIIKWMGYIYMEETLLLIMQIVSGEEMHILEKVVSELGRTHADFLQICSL